MIEEKNPNILLTSIEHSTRLINDSLIISKNKRLAAAIAEIQGVFKDGELKDDKGKIKYIYARVDDMYTETRGILGKHELVPWQSQEFCEFRQRISTRDGSVIGENIFGKFNHCILGGEQLFPHPMEIESLFLEAPKFGVQSFAALRTFSSKYYLRNKLMLPTGSDIDDFDSQFVQEQEEKESSQTTSGKTVKAKWVATKSGELIAQGEWPSEKSRLDSMFRAMKAAFTLPQDPSRKQLDFVEMIANKNTEKIQELPAEAFDKVVEMLHKLDINIPEVE